MEEKLTDAKIARFQDADEAQAAGRALTLYGGLMLPATLGEVFELARFMAEGGIAVPAHLRGKPGTCVAVIQRSLAWQMDPWAVATKTYAVNDILAYEAQLIAAVIKKWAPIRERVLAPKYTGEGQALICSFALHHSQTGEEIEYESPKIGEINPKNSPLWKSEPKQQLFYYSVRAMARRHFPEIIMGVYDREEVLAMKDVTPQSNALDDGADAPGHVHQGEVIPPKDLTTETQREWMREHKAGKKLMPEAAKSANQVTREAETKTQVDTEIPHDPETGEIDEEPATRLMPDGDDFEERETAADRPEADQQQGFALDEPDANKIKVNLMKGVKACKTLKDLDAWKAENPEALKDRDIRKAASDKAFEIEDDPGRF